MTLSKIPTGVAFEENDICNPVMCQGGGPLISLEVTAMNLLHCAFPKKWQGHRK